MHTLRYNRKTESTGFTLVEIMIAIGLLALVSFGIASFLSSAKKTSITVQGNSACAAEAQTIVEKIAGLGVRDQVLTYIRTTEGPSTNPLPTVLPQNISAILGANYSWFHAPLVQFDATRQLSILHNSQLLLSSAQMAEALLNSNPTLCETGFEINNTSSLMLSNSSLKNPKIKLLIQPISVAAGAVYSCADLPIFSSPQRKITQTPADVNSCYFNII